MNKVVICGASGLVGSRLFEHLGNEGRSITVVGRNAASLKLRFPTAEAWLDWDGFAASDPTTMSAIINLAGAGVMDRRWSDTYKHIMTTSRVASTSSCARHAAANREIRLINASAVHAYGIYPGDHNAFVEGDQPRPGGEACFLHDLITAWEAAAQPALEAKAPVALLRLGVVLDSTGGALENMLPLFRAFLGGKQGSGRQIMPWISIDDVVAGIVFLLERPEITGPVNFVSTGACTNAEVMRNLGKALGRPSLLPMPGFLLRALLGGAGTELVLGGQRVEPRVLLDHGFEFQDNEIEACLRRLMKKETRP